MHRLSNRYKFRGLNLHRDHILMMLCQNILDSISLMEKRESGVSFRGSSPTVATRSRFRWSSESALEYGQARSCACLTVLRAAVSALAIFFCSCWLVEGRPNCGPLRGCSDRGRGRFDRLAHTNVQIPVQDLLITCVDNLTGFSQAISACYPGYPEMYHPSNSQLHTLRVLQGSQESNGRFEANLQSNRSWIASMKLGGKCCTNYPYSSRIGSVRICLDAAPPPWGSLQKSLHNILDRPFLEFEPFFISFLYFLKSL